MVEEKPTCLGEIDRSFPERCDGCNVTDECKKLKDKIEKKQPSMNDIQRYEVYLDMPVIQIHNKGKFIKVEDYNTKLDEISNEDIEDWIMVVIEEYKGSHNILETLCSFVVKKYTEQRLKIKVVV